MDKNKMSLIDTAIAKSSVIISIPLLTAFDKMNGNNFIIKKEAFKNYLEKPNVKELFKTGSFYIEDIDIDTIRDYDCKSIFITDLTKTIGTILDINIDQGIARIKLDPKYIEKFCKMKNPVLSFIYAVDKFEGEKNYFREIKNIICMKPCIIEGSESCYNKINKGRGICKMILDTEHGLYSYTNKDAEKNIDKYIDTDSEEFSIPVKYVIDNLSKQIYIGLINRNPHTLKLISEEDQTEELCILALSKDPSTIKYVKNKDLYNKLKSIL